VVSSTHAFGHNREGSPAVLEAWGTRRGIGVAVVPPVTDGGVVISSTAIRDRLRAGDVRAAAAWLGRWYSATGAVIAGEGRGKTLGFPTANLDVPAAKVIPRQGVYAAYATVDGQTYPAAVNVGVRPTFGGGGPSVEAHLIGADLSLYDRSMTLAFVEHLRLEQRFSSADALRAQISADVERVGKILQTEADLDSAKPA
jgi:riboflavin kinase/FMN adenylyltransferase